MTKRSRGGVMDSQLESYGRQYKTHLPTSAPYTGLGLPANDGGSIENKIIINTSVNANAALLVVDPPLVDGVGLNQTRIIELYNEDASNLVRFYLAEQDEDVTFATLTGKGQPLFPSSKESIKIDKTIRIVIVNNNGAAVNVTVTVLDFT